MRLVGYLAALAVALACSPAGAQPIDHSASLYRRLAHDALSYFYHNRSGTPIEARYAGGEQWARPAGHPSEKVSCFAGLDSNGNKWPGCDYVLDVSGGWYDAGDHGKYVVNGGISLWTLLNLYEVRGNSPLFTDGRHPIPEAGNGVNDLLDEFALGDGIPACDAGPARRETESPGWPERPIAAACFYVGRRRRNGPSQDCR